MNLTLRTLMATAQNPTQWQTDDVRWMHSALHRRNWAESILDRQMYEMEFRNRIKINGSPAEWLMAVCVDDDYYAMPQVHFNFEWFHAVRVWP